MRMLVHLPALPARIVAETSAERRGSAQLFKSKLGVDRASEIVALVQDLERRDIGEVVRPSPGWSCLRCARTDIVRHRVRNVGP